MPQDTRDAKIITLFQNKGERSDCNNYRVISLHSVIGKVFAKVILIELHKLAERVYTTELYTNWRAPHGIAEKGLMRERDGAVPPLQTPSFSERPAQRPTLV